MATRPFYIRDDDPPAKREILRAALKLFSGHGLEGTSIRDIARESGYTNPALYKHFRGKDELALHLFETCHQHVWSACSAAIAAADGFDRKLEAYVSRWLEFVDGSPLMMAFLSDSARVLWPKSSANVRRRTMIGLAQSLFQEARKGRRRRSAMEVDMLAASLEGTIAELARMIQVGVVAGPATRWKGTLVNFFRKAAA
jgi:AcrR family transcriptional regulator